MNDLMRVTQALTFLETQREAQPALAQVAGHVGLSPAHFQRLFVRHVGVSPKRFVQFLTLERAKGLLRAPSSVLDSALDAGLSGPGRLHDLFVGLEAVTPGEFKARGEGVQMSCGQALTLLGPAFVAWTSRGVSWLAFVDAGRAAKQREALQGHWPEAVLREDGEGAQAKLDEIFDPMKAGQAQRLLVRGTNFQVQVWRALLRIPEGSMCSYGDVARALGKPGAARAVGSAVGSNHLAFLIPCHRVLRASGHFGGYRWGLPVKRRLLAWEAARGEG